MDSSEKVDSGKFSGRRSNFSQTCSRLSRYLKEKGSFEDLNNLVLAQNLEPRGTMDLLPMIDRSPAVKSEPETAPMTIFYGGQVIVFNDFPASKADEIMTLASKSSVQNIHRAAAFTQCSAAQSPAESASNVSLVPDAGVQNPAQPPPLMAPLGSDLPIARKNSLARFLEKRKDRVMAIAPYQAIKPEALPKKITSEPGWLGLSP